MAGVSQDTAGTISDMRPYSRGTPPEQFTLRLACQIGHQFSLSDSTIPINFQVNGVACKATQENMCLLFTATGFSNIVEAKVFFTRLQGTIAALSLRERIAISIPSQLVEPVQADFSFMAEDIRCTSHGWPQEVICPLLIPNIGACIYPEHKYVAITETIIAIPRFTYSLSSLVDQLALDMEDQQTNNPVDEILLVAIAGYAQAARSTQWVWSFLLIVMTLEMLATESSSSDETKATIKNLIKYAEITYSNIGSINLERIKDCIRQANKISKTSAVKALVKKYCAPGLSSSPLPDKFADADDCDHKIAAIYNVRSKYVHEGRIASRNKPKYEFGELHAIAIESLKHILQAKLDESVRYEQPTDIR